MNVFAFTDHREYLGALLRQRQERNGRYSLRAFARDLDLSASYLSEVINGGNRGLSPAGAATIAGKLGLAKRETSYFVALAERESGRTEKSRQAAAERVREERMDAERYRIGLDQFDMISSWYHFALLELLKIRGVKATSADLAERLDMPKTEVKAALERLTRLGFLVKEGRGYAVSRDRTRTESETPSRALQALHRSLLAKADEALLTQDLATREPGAVIFRSQRSKVPAMKDMMERFRFDFTAAAKDDEAGDEVYGMTVQLFRLDRDPEKRDLQ